ncbi:hypothetical protein BDN67DRAFT_969646 [Paxillus ammoniavirescens]|nr:hypothetical protein BDN67DRAFT_969646 [Paxillus ammoniavirescens]
MSFTGLPGEILSLILQTAVADAAIPSDILRVCQLFHDVGTECLYTHLRFTAPKQLQLFAMTRAPETPLIVPRSVTVDLTGKQDFYVFRCLHDAFIKCKWLADEALARREGGDGDARMKRISLRMHSYARDTEVELLAEGLCAVSPDAFEWTGPDPDHHFSTAIIPPVASCLFKHITSWSNVREVKVTNISFATRSVHEGPFPPLIADLPSLRTLYIGQATFLHPQAIAGMFCQGRMSSMWQVRLVDAYSESIWGPRLRRSDVEKAAKTLCHTDDQNAVIARIKRVVTCEKKTERIMGGDRVEGTHILY